MERGRSASELPDPRKAVPASETRRAPGSSSSSLTPDDSPTRRMTEVAPRRTSEDARPIEFGQDPRRAQPAASSQPVQFGQDPRKARPAQQAQQQPPPQQRPPQGQDPRNARPAQAKQDPRRAQPPPQQQQQAQPVQFGQDPRRAQPAGGQPVQFGQDPRKLSLKPDPSRAQPAQTRRAEAQAGDPRRAQPAVRSVPLAQPGPSGPSSSSSVFSAETRKHLKLEFAKADRNRDGWLTAEQFDVAFAAAARIVPRLKQIPRSVAAANFKANATAKGVNINEFLHMLEQMYSSVRGSEDIGSDDEGHEAARRRSSRKSMTAADLKRRASTTMRHVGKWFGVVDTDMEEVHQQHNSRVSTRRKKNKHDVQGAGVSDKPPSETMEMKEFAPAAKPTGKLIYDYDQALAQYRRYIQRERAMNRSRMRHEWYSADAAAAGQRGDDAAPKRKLDRSEINAKLRSLPTFKPYFIPLMTFVQFILILAMCAHSWREEEFGKISLSNDVELCSTSGNGPACPNSFKCESSALCPNEAATRTTHANMWIGPDIRYLISFGAKFTPCMRDDREIDSKLAAQREAECGVPGNLCDSGTGDEGYGCCELTSARSGMANKTYCDSLGGTWNKHQFCPDTAQIVIRPCCVGYVGDCEIITESDCLWRDGVYHDDHQLCSEVNCLAGTCELQSGATIGTNSKLKNQPESPNQWYRFILPLFLHAGIIHFGLIIAVQWTIGKTMEKSIGFLRIFLIYFISGIGGYVISGVFAPTQVDVGSDPAVFGLLAVLIVELFQSWQIVPNKWTELLKLILLIAVALLVGTFPFVDNFGHVAGFVFGIPAAIIFLPYITFGKWDLARKRILLVICVPVLFFMFIIGFVTFYQVQDTEFCSWCKHVNCIQYTDDIACDS